MNFVQSLSTAFCGHCGDEVHPDSLNDFGNCMTCRIDLKMAVEAEQALDRLHMAFEEIVNFDIERVVKKAQTRAHTLHPTVYSLSTVISESMQHAQKLLGPKFHAESLISDLEPVTSSERDSRVSA